MTNPITVGSICTGYGGIELALDLAGVDHRLEWASEIDPTASAVLADHWPHVPNLGDINNANPEPVDLITAGFPCQDISVAGQQAGIHGERSGLWWRIRDVVGDLRPQWVLLENVAAITVNGGPAVVGSLAELGYDSRWGIVRASDAGAPHQRARWFCIATDANGERQQSVWGSGLQPGQRDTNGRSGEIVADPPSVSGNVISTSRSKQHQQHIEAGRRNCDVRLMDDGIPLGHGETSQARSGQALSDVWQTDATQSVQWPTRRSDQVSESAQLFSVVRQHPERPDQIGISQTGRTAQEIGMPRLWDYEQSDYSPHRPGLAQQQTEQLGDLVQQVPHDFALAGRLGRFEAAISAWGKYGPAVATWAAIIGRLPPSPAINGRLNPRAVEWMMGLPDQWINHGSRAAQLRCLGNGVVPQQAALALRLLTDD